MGSRLLENDPLEAFIRQAPPIDDVREEAARCATETARAERGERPRLRGPDDSPLLAEFSDAAFGVAAEVATIVGEGLLAAGIGFRMPFVWDTAARLLREGWQRGHKFVAHKVAAARDRS